MDDSDSDVSIQKNSKCVERFFFNDVAILISSTHCVVPWYKPIINRTQLHLGLPHHWITITDKKTVITGVYIYILYYK